MLDQQTTQRSPLPRSEFIIILKAVMTERKIIGINDRCEIVTPVLPIDNTLKKTLKTIAKPKTRAHLCD